MKRKNTHTGDIVDFDAVILVKDGANGEDPAHLEYPSLEAAMEEWEDFEEPNGIVKVEKSIVPNCVCIECTTEEEAEKAVEKLKAWERLKDKGFRFTGYTNNSGDLFSSQVIRFTFTDFSTESRKDQALLFGGEE